MTRWLLAPGPEDTLTSLADALDAGLPAESALAVAGLEQAAEPGAPIHESLARALADLSATERMVLRAAEQGGALAAALRRLAEDRRVRRARLRALTGRLAYPILVVLVAALVSLLFAAIGMPGLGLGFWGGAVVVVAAGIGLAVYARRRLRTDPGFELPVLAVPVARAAATPYFEAVLALYAAGVRIDQAHGEAVATCPHAALRARLVAAQTSLVAGASYAEALGTAGAFEDGVRTILRDAERSGNLESGLRHVITRLRAATDAATQNAIRVLGGLAYGGAVLVVLVTVARFYGGLAEQLGGIGR